MCAIASYCLSPTLENRGIKAFAAGMDSMGHGCFCLWPPKMAIWPVEVFPECACACVCVCVCVCVCEKEGETQTESERERDGERERDRPD